MCLRKARMSPGTKKGIGLAADPHFHNPSQGNNPNTTLTRPQHIRLLTLVGE